MCIAQLHTRQLSITLYLLPVWHVGGRLRSILTLLHGIRYVFGPTLDYRLKETFLKHLKGVLSIHFRVCLSTKTYIHIYNYSFKNVLLATSICVWLFACLSVCPARLLPCLYILTSTYAFFKTFLFMDRFPHFLDIRCSLRK